MNLLRLINPSLAHVDCSNLLSNYGFLLDSLDSPCNLQSNYAITFLFYLDLMLHACAAR